MTTTIEVTQEDIDNGQQVPNFSKCPVALAIKRYHPRLGVRVYSTYFEISDSQSRCKIGLPNEAVKFINLYDNKGKKAVKPIKFDIELEEIYHAK